MGLVIEVGNDCQIYRVNQQHHCLPTGLQREITATCLNNFFWMLVLACATGLVVQSVHQIPLFTAIRKTVLLLNTMVPLSLQFFFNIGSGIMSKRIEQRLPGVQVNRNGLMAFQHQPQCVVTDKTGTVTTNQLEVAQIIIDSVDIPLPSLPNWLPNLLACTEIQPHSQTGQLMPSDPIEHQLLSLALQGRRLHRNSIDQAGHGEIIVDDLSHYRRHYYRPYDYQLEVKIGVIQASGDAGLVLHVQGTPKLVNRYSGGQITDTLQQLEVHPGTIQCLSPNHCSWVEANHSDTTRAIEQSPWCVTYRGIDWRAAAHFGLRLL